MADGARGSSSGDGFVDPAPGMRVARLIARHGNRFETRALDGSREYSDAVSRGRNTDLVVGDVVDVRNEQGLQVIERAHPRRSLLFRSDANRTKPLAANVDQVAIVFAPRPSPLIDFIWRALMAAQAAGIAALAIRNKCDLPDDACDAMLKQAQTLGAATTMISVRGDPVHAIESLEPLMAGRSTVLVGQSGMGKSSLSNLLLGTDTRTGALTRRETHGRQTTTTARWFEFDAPRSGALIDSPGFQAFGLAHLAPEDILAAMPDLAGVPGQCRFANCRHDREPGCRIREAMAGGLVTPERHAFYLRLVQDAGRA